MHSQMQCLVAHETHTVDQVVVAERRGDGVLALVRSCAPPAAPLRHRVPQLGDEGAGEAIHYFVHIIFLPSGTAVVLNMTNLDRHDTCRGSVLMQLPGACDWHEKHHCKQR